MGRKRTALIISFVTSLLSVTSAFGAADPRCSTRPVKWNHEIRMIDENLSYSGFLERMVENYGSAGINDYTPRPNLPKRFPGETSDETEKILSEKYPVVRSQNPFGSRWAHAAIADEDVHHRAAVVAEAARVADGFGDVAAK